MNANFIRGQDRNVLFPTWSSPHSVLGHFTSGPPPKTFLLLPPPAKGFRISTSPRGDLHQADITAAHLHALQKLHVHLAAEGAFKKDSCCTSQHWHQCNPSPACPHRQAWGRDRKETVKVTAPCPRRTGRPSWPAHVRKFLHADEDATRSFANAICSSMPYPHWQLLRIRFTVSRP